MTTNNESKSPETVAADARSAFRKLGKSVCILSCHSDDKPHASVATAVCNVSNSPPSVLVCLEKSASMATLLQDSALFAINVLGADQQDIVEHCMNSSGPARFDAGDWQTTGDQLPVLNGSQAVLCCRVAEVHSFDTHHIVVARIVDSQCGESTSGLIYLGGKFHCIE